jgi:hypothetical protein
MDSFEIIQELIEKRGMSREQVVNAGDISIHKLPHMDNLYRQVKDEVDNLHRIRHGLINDIAARKNKILVLDKIAFSSEQECKRKEQRVQ